MTGGAAMTLSVSQIPLSEIQLPKKLIKEHPEHQIRQIAQSIQTYGFNDPVAVDEQGTIIEGAGRILAARMLALETIPAIVLKHLSEAQKRAYRIAHNKITLNTGFDLEALRMEFDILSQLDESLLAITGFEPVELDDLLKTPEVPELGPELTESLKSQSKTVVCPHCGGTVHV
jgi:ParB family chromosome partitioning protein